MKHICCLPIPNVLTVPECLWEQRKHRVWCLIRVTYILFSFINLRHSGVPPQAVLSARTLVGSGVLFPWYSGVLALQQEEPPSYRRVTSLPDSEEKNRGRDVGCVKCHVYSSRTYAPTDQPCIPASYLSVDRWSSSSSLGDRWLLGVVVVGQGWAGEGRGGWTSLKELVGGRSICQRDKMHDTCGNPTQYLYTTRGGLV